jgi:hypothetical protein
MTVNGREVTLNFTMRSLTPFAVVLLLAFEVRAKPSHVTINSDQVLVIDGKKTFPIGFTMPPPPEGRTPQGKSAIKELADAGANFLRTGAQGGPWDEARMRIEEKYMDAGARYGLHTLPFLREFSAVTNDLVEANLRKLVNRFKNHPGFGAWKGDDEPEWGKRPLEPLIRTREIIRELDPNHPLVVIHAPRGTVDSLRRYNGTGDILGMDIYPISYPPGVHSEQTNRNLSMVGDFTRMMMDVAQDKMPVWMVLQISFSGVLKSGKTLRFPTFPEERFMTYEAIINGARGLIYFGGSNEASLNERDRKLGWNWTFWQRVLRPVIEEIGSKSPLYPALLAPKSALPVQVVALPGRKPAKLVDANGPEGIEFCVRQVGQNLFLLACKREGETIQVEFSGLPRSTAKGEVMYEAPRTVEAKDGKFKDWFAPFEVHVYRFKL